MHAGVSSLIPCNCSSSSSKGSNSAAAECAIINWLGNVSGATCMAPVTSSLAAARLWLHVMPKNRKKSSAECFIFVFYFARTCNCVQSICTKKLQTYYAVTHAQIFQKYFSKIAHWLKTESRPSYM